MSRPSTTNSELSNEVLTLKKRIEELEQSEAMYRSLVENSLAGVYIYQDKLVRYANIRWCEILGYTDKDVIDRLNPEDVTHPDDMCIIKESVDRCLAGKSDCYSFAHRFVRKDGKEITVIVHGSSIIHEGRTALSGNMLDVTDYVRAAETVRQTEKKYRSIFENAIEGIYQTTPEGRHISANPSLAKMFGFDSPKEMIETISDIGQQNYVYPEDRERLKRLLEEKGTVEGFEVQNYRKDGNIFWMSINARAVRNSEGQILYYEGTAEDITKQKQTEEKLRLANQRLFDIIDFLPDATFVLDRKKSVVAWNRTCEEMTGVKKEDIMGRGEPEYAIPFYGKPHLMVIDRVFGEDQNGKKKHSYPDKGVFSAVYVPTAYQGRGAYLSGKASLLFDSKGDIAGAIESIRDVTEQKHIENALQESEERYRIAIESSNDAIVMVKDGKHFYVNRKFLEIFGFDSPDQVIGKPVGLVTHPDERETTNEMSRSGQLSKDVRQRYVFRGIKTNGEELYIEASAAKTTYKGEPITLVYFRDITARMNLEAQFRQAQKMEAVGTLAGGVAHDFNNILTAIMGYAGLLRERLGTDSLLGTYADHILSSGNKAARLIKGLLAFSRKQPMILNPINLNIVITETEELLKPLLTEDITLETRLTSDDTTVMGDSTQIDQILLNLVANARDAMINGGSLIIETKLIKMDEKFVETHGYGEIGFYVQLTVSDNGTGMDEDTKKHVFDPFFTTKEVGKGTGLGLATVYGIVKKHNGYINVYSEVNTGTSFRIYFPAVTAGVRGEAPVFIEIEGGSETILIAEDDDTVRGFVREVLMEKGYTIIEATDGEDALNKFRTHGDISLLILDSVMPKMSGKEVHDEVKKIHSGAKILFMSGHTMDVILSKGIEEKRFHFISKPLSQDELLRKVRDALRD